MSPADYRRMRELFDRLSPLDAAGRASALDSSLPPGDPIRAELEDLLALTPPEPDEPDEPEAAPARSPLAPGDRLLQRYRVLRLLGTGGFARTYLAADEQLHDKPVVVKTPLPVEARNRAWFERHYTDEIRALAALDHPGIVGVLDSGEDPVHGPFFVLQYIDGPTLGALAKRGRLALPRLEKLLDGIGQALAAAHARGIIHRDLKPDNILIRAEGTPEESPVLIDFGIASLTAGPGDRPATTRVVGSPNYWAPEQLWGKVLPQSDIYALGCIAIELLTGEVLHQHVSKANSTEAAAAQLLADRRPDLAEQTRRELAQLVTIDSEKRPATVKSLRLRVAAPLAQPDESRRSWLGLAATGVGIGGVLWFVARQVEPPAAPPSPPELILTVRATRVNAQGEQPLDWMRDRVTRLDRLRLELTVNPEAHIYVFAHSGSFALLFPSRVGEALRRTARVPATASDWIEFDNQPERVRFLFLLSADPLPEAEQAIAAAQRGVVPPAERDRLLARAGDPRPLAVQAATREWQARGPARLLVAETFLEHVAL